MTLPTPALSSPGELLSIAPDVVRDVQGVDDSVDAKEAIRSRAWSLMCACACSIYLLLLLLLRRRSRPKRQRTGLIHGKGRRWRAWRPAALLAWPPRSGIGPPVLVDSQPDASNPRYGSVSAPSRDATRRTNSFTVPQGGLSPGWCVSPGHRATSPRAQPHRSSRTRSPSRGLPRLQVRHSGRTSSKSGPALLFGRLKMGVPRAPAHRRDTVR